MSTLNKGSSDKLDAVKKYINHFDHANETQSINGFVQLLKDINIKMVVFDFDLTIIGAHSGGYVDKANDIDNIGTSVTTHFKIFSKELNTNNIKITVATFSDDEAIRHSRGKNSTLIAGEDMVKFSMKNSKCDARIEKVYAYYPPYYREPRQYRPLGLTKPMSYDKSYHLKQIRSDFEVTIDEILFIDDDVNNCISAKKEGYITFNVTGKKGFNFKNIKIM
ncbi:conserved Plasmodium protein, unknown function [Plasmodium gonderi]|uniref:Uncharacterized protein n=1 Tax=Plasmodium gonderi TaxID=77519 RepID=A0A1Y1JFZ1_PLAGO|nr:conserved Plasmodium protein, unknown function [Plasmodium gonderi]GAW79353.1 conserved Plasmodium protein, unknown function [Plasmodium gonderi]